MCRVDLGDTVCGEDLGVDLLCVGVDLGVLCAQIPAVVEKPQLVSTF